MNRSGISPHHTCFIFSVKYFNTMMIAPNSRAHKGGKEEKGNGTMEELEGNADYRGMVQPSRCTMCKCGDQCTMWGSDKRGFWNETINCWTAKKLCQNSSGKVKILSKTILVKEMIQQIFSLTCIVKNVTNFFHFRLQLVQIKNLLVRSFKRK